METASGGHRKWWGTFAIQENTAVRWRVGALTLWIEHKPNEWRIAHVSTGDPFDATVDMSLLDEAPSPSDDLAVNRLAGDTTDGSIRITPVLPDRPVVSRPDVPFHVLAREETRVYVSTPVWLKIETGKPPRPLLELPLYRSSDTWFGPNTLEGELCYASRTACRQSLEDLPPRPQRAITPVRIQNRTDKTLLVERFNLPVPFLPLVATPDGTLWTHAVTVEIAREGETAEIQVAKKPPSEARGASAVGPPRSDEGQNMFTRALGALIG